MPFELILRPLSSCSWRMASNRPQVPRSSFFLLKIMRDFACLLLFLTLVRSATTMCGQGWHYFQVSSWVTLPGHSCDLHTAMISSQWHDHGNLVCAKTPSPSTVPPSFQKLWEIGNMLGTGRAGEAKDVLLNNPLLLHCETSAAPPPTLTWYKDGRPLTSGDRVLVLPGKWPVPLPIRPMRGIYCPASLLSDLRLIKWVIFPAMLLSCIRPMTWILFSTQDSGFHY